MMGNNFFRQFSSTSLPSVYCPGARSPAPPLAIWDRFNIYGPEAVTGTEIDTFMNGSLEWNPRLARRDITTTKESISMISRQDGMNCSIGFVHGQVCGWCRRLSRLQDQILTSQECIKVKVRVGRRRCTCQTHNHGLVNGLKRKSTFAAKLITEFGQNFENLVRGRRSEQESVEFHRREANFTFQGFEFFVRAWRRRTPIHGNGTKCSAFRQGSNGHAAIIATSITL